MTNQVRPYEPLTSENAVLILVDCPRWEPARSWTSEMYRRATFPGRQDVVWARVIPMIRRTIPPHNLFYGT